MRNSTHLITYILAGILVIILGGVTGWYIFVQRQIAETQATDAARGLGTSAPSFSSGSGQSGVFGGSAGNSSGFASSGSSTIATGSTGRAAPRLWHITTSPVAGVHFVASSSLVYFVERSNGNLLYADQSLSQITRVTNTLFPKIHEAYFADNGSVVLRWISDSGAITTFAGRVASTTDTGAPRDLLGITLASNIPAIAVRANTADLFWLLPGGQSGVTGITSDWKGSSQKKLFTSGLRGWSSLWLGDGMIYLVQNPTDDLMGYAFRLSPSGTLTPVMGNVPGLTLLPRANSTAILYGTSAAGTISLYSQTTDSASPIRLSVRTVANKCVWAPGKRLIAYCAVPQSFSSAAFLRDWYSGALHTADAWWRIDTSTGTAEIVYRPDPSITLDVQNPTIDSNGNYIAFMNGVDNSPWMLRI